MQDSPLEYQKTVLTDVVDEAIREGSIAAEDGDNLQERIDEIDSLTEADRYWNRLFERYDLPENN